MSKTQQLWSQIVAKTQPPQQKHIEPTAHIPTEHHDMIDTNHVWSLSFIFWFAGIVVVYVWYLLFSSLDLVYLIFTGYVLSMAVEKMIGWFSSKLWHSRWWGIFVSYFIFVAVLLSWVLIMIPFLGTQIADIGSIALDQISNIQNQLETIGLDQMVSNASRIPSAIRDSLVWSLGQQEVATGLQKLFQDNMDQIASTSSDYLQGAGGVAVNIVSSVFSALTQIGFVLTLSVLFSVEKDNTMKLIRRIDKKNKSNRHNKITKIYEKLGFWLRSQLLLCLFIFCMTGVGLLILSWFGLDIPNILSLALIAWLTEIIPYVGPLIGSVPALLVGTINSGVAGFIGVGILFFVIQRCENNILIPWIMNKTLWVSSLLIFICMLIGASTLGFIGILLAVPIAIIISIAMEE